MGKCWNPLCPNASDADWILSFWGQMYMPVIRAVRRSPRLGYIVFLVRSVASSGERTPFDLSVILVLTSATVKGVPRISLRRLLHVGERLSPSLRRKHISLPQSSKLSHGANRDFLNIERLSRPPIYKVVRLSSAENVATVSCKRAYINRSIR